MSINQIISNTGTSKIESSRKCACSCDIPVFYRRNGADRQVASKSQAQCTITKNPRKSVLHLFLAPLVLLLADDSQDMARLWWLKNLEDHRWVLLESACGDDYVGILWVGSILVCISEAVGAAGIFIVHIWMMIISYFKPNNCNMI